MIRFGAWLGTWLSWASAAAVIAVVRGYQLLLSPLLGAHCRFQPTCSQYCIDAVRRYGVVRGGFKSLRRIARCHPWHQGGYDPP